MRQLLRSTWGWLATAAGSALAALFLLMVTPFPADVLGQTPPGPSQTGQVAPGGTATIGGVTVDSQSNQACNLQLTGSQLQVACPGGFTVSVQGAFCTAVGGQPNVAVCTVASGERVTLSTGAGQPLAAPRPEGAGVATGGAAGTQPAVPVALPRTGAGIDADRGLTAGTLLALGLLGIAAALGSGARASRLPYSWVRR